MDQARDAVAPDGDHGGGYEGKTGTSAPSQLPQTASARLRAAREALGLTTGDIAARTRITIRHVEALDRGDLAALPGRPYVLGFVRNYARAVGLDGAELATLARSEMDASVPRPVPRMVHQFDVDDPAKIPSRLVTWAALGLVIAVLGAGGVFWRSYYAPGAALPSLVEPDSAPKPRPAVVAKPAAVPAGPVVFTAREDGIWVKFYDGHGTQLLQKQLARGESYTVPADAVDPKLWTGRPEALTITVAGQAVAPLSDKRGIVRDVPVTAQALLARAPVAAASPPAVSPAAAPGVTSLPTAASAPAQSRHKSRRTAAHVEAAPAASSTPVAADAPLATTTPAPLPQ
jgi:transcriptional regulator with XRE-family HTH domain